MSVRVPVGRDALVADAAVTLAGVQQEVGLLIELRQRPDWYLGPYG